MSPAPRPAEAGRAMEPRAVASDPCLPVGIVGAGPVGMICALRLAGFGIPSVILEADPALRKQGSKACLIQGDVLEVLDKVGCADEVAATGVTWRIGHTYVRGEEIVRTEYPERPGFGPFVNISQYRIEQILLARLEDHPLGDVRWSHQLVGLTQHAGWVTAKVLTPDGTRDMRFRYLVACDGIRSAARAFLGVDWTGYSHGDRFLITDIRARLPLAKERHFHYDPPFNPGRQLVMHPQPDDMWRIDWQLAPDTDIEDERRTGRLDRRIRDVIGDVPYEIDWLSTYRFNQRVVARMRVSRVFFAGDAAHALPPYGARGMNSGIQDADNLAWKLAMVLTGQAGDGILETYHAERHAAAKENLRVTEATIKFMVPPNRYQRWLRNTLLWLSRPFKSVRRHVNSGTMAEPYVYLDSPIIDRSGGGPLTGSFAPDGTVIADGRTTRLRRLFGQAFVGLYFGSDPESAARFVEQSMAHGSAVDTRFVLAFPSGTKADAAPPGSTVVHYDDPAIRSHYDTDLPRWYLVRPDGHIAAAYRADRPADFAGVLARCSAGLPFPGRGLQDDTMRDRAIHAVH